MPDYRYPTVLENEEEFTKPVLVECENPMMPEPGPHMSQAEIHEGACEECDPETPGYFERQPGQNRYINAYEVTLAYGGPEEGGWHYEVGTPIASVPVHGLAQARAIYDTMHALLTPRYDRPRRRTNEPSLQLIVEDRFARAYPRERPHYC